MSKLILGTTQFGLSYGINNKAGQLALAEAHKLIDMAIAVGAGLDTAAAYGTSEAVIGLHPRHEQLTLITKIREEDPARLETVLRESLARLHLKKAYAVLLHSFDQYEKDPAIMRRLLELKRDGLMAKAGVSLYYPAQALRMLSDGIIPDVVQVPYSVLDRRFESVFPALKAAGVEIHVRSIYLQGLLLMTPDSLPQDFDKIRPKIEFLRKTALENRLPVSATCALFVARNPEVDRIVVGVDSTEQFSELLKYFSSGNTVNLSALDDLAETDEKLLLPFNWINQGNRCIAVIQARTGSTRLPGKVLLDLKGKTVLQRVIERVRAAKKVSRVIVATTTAKSDDVINNLCERLGCECFRGSEDDVLDRFYMALLPFKPENIVRITADCPFTDPQLINQVVSLKESTAADYASNIIEETYPDGECVEVFSFSALERAWRESKLTSEREHVTPYIRKPESNFRLRNLKSTVFMGDKRWTLDMQADYQFILAVYERLDNELAGIEEILAVLRANPQLEKINSSIARNEGYVKSLKTDQKVTLPYKLGLKLYSTNDCYLKAAVSLFEQGIYDFIELLPVPGSCASTLSWWKDMRIPFVVHAPHFSFGVNLGQRALFEKNMVAVKETLAFADMLNAAHIVFHPGTEGDIRESARQLKAINDHRILIENKPYKTVDGRFKCIGGSHEEIKFIMDTTGVGFCLDIGHAISYATNIGADWHDYLRGFVAMNPSMYHVSDGDLNSGTDTHTHIGEGNYDWGRIIPLLPAGAFLTIETKKDFPSSLEDFRKDANSFKRLSSLTA